MLSLPGTPRKTNHKQKNFNECKEYIEYKRVITACFKPLCRNYSICEQDHAITNILDLLPRIIYFDIFPPQMKHNQPLSSDDILNVIQDTSSIGSSTGFKDGVHEWILYLPPTYAADGDYHYYFGVVTNVNDYVHSDYSESNGVAYIASTFGDESAYKLKQNKPKHKPHEIRIRLDCQKWIMQMWINNEIHDSVACIINGEYIENEDISTEHALMTHETYFPVISIYKKDRYYGIR